MRARAHVCVYVCVCVEAEGGLGVLTEQGDDDSGRSKEEGGMRQWVGNGTPRVLRKLRACSTILL